MCVVALCNESTRLNEVQIEDMYEANDHGAGIAWREKKGKKVVVKWAKGLDLEQMKSLALTVPLPYVAHFRIPTCGPMQGIYAPLCHPFPISEQVELLEEGEYEGFVLFHNGGLFDWESKFLDYACKGGWKIPDGKWSDSRAMAKIAHHMGIGVLAFFKQRVCLFSPEQIFMVGDGWIYPIQDEKPLGFWVSNLQWRDRSAWKRTRKSTSSSAQAEKEAHTQQAALVLRQPLNFQPEITPTDSQAGSGPTLDVGSLTTRTQTIGSPTERPGTPTIGQSPGGGLTNGYQVLARIPKDATVRQGPGGTLRIVPFQRGVTGMRDPSNPEFEFEVTDHIYHIAKLLSLRKDSTGARLLSKSRMKKIEFANQLWRERKRKEITETLKAQQDRLDSGLKKIPMLH